MMPPSAAPTLSALLTRDRWLEIGRIVATGLAALLYWRHLIPLPVLLVAVAVGLYPLVKKGLYDLVKERKVGTEIFVTIATLVAVFGGETVAGAVLMVIILIAEFIADLNTDRARASIKGLIGSVPQVATVRADGAERSVPIAALRIGDVVLVKAGEKIPVDGTVTGGGGAVNEAPITGESVPREKEVGATVFAGTVLESGALDVTTDKLATDTMFARIIALVEQAEEHQARVAKLADKVAAWLIPAVLVFLVVIFLVTHNVRTIVTLMIFTSPAELGLATPLVMISAIARAAQNGVLVKGGIYLESLAKVDVIVFDKTGTLTVGKPRVQKVVPEEGVAEAELLRLAAAADRRSAHPLAKAVVDHAAGAGVEVPEPEAFEVLRGRGVKATVGGVEVLVGNAALLTEGGVATGGGAADDGLTTVFVAAGGRLMGRGSHRRRGEARREVSGRAPQGHGDQACRDAHGRQPHDGERGRRGARRR
jgi:Cd2+/Zn2+-exporting ATPase